MTRGNVLDSISWTSNGGVTPNETTSGTSVTLDKGTVTAFYEYNEAETTLHLENINNPRLVYDGYCSYISVSEIQNNEATVSVLEGTGTQIEGIDCEIEVYDGENLITTLTLHVQREPSYYPVTGATYTQYIGNEDMGAIDFSGGVDFKALDVENDNTTVTIKVSYGGKTATDTVTYTVSPARTYYWYIGQTDPSTMDSITPLPSNDASEGAGWRLIGNQLPTYNSSNRLWSNSTNGDINMPGMSNIYIAVPNTTLMPHDGLGVSGLDNGSYERLSNTKTIDKVTYTSYKSTSQYLLTFTDEIF